MNYIHYTDIVKDIQAFFNNHIQVNQFLNISEADFNANKNVFPAVILVPQPSTFYRNQLNLSFNLVVCDILTESRDNTKDVYSDTLDIIRDFLAEFTDNPELDWGIDENETITPFEEKYDDILAGWVLNFNVLVPISLNQCEVPSYI